MPEKGCPISTDEVEYLHARAQRLGQPQPVPFSAVELHFEAEGAHLARHRRAHMSRVISVCFRGRRTACSQPARGHEITELITIGKHRCGVTCR